MPREPENDDRALEREQMRERLAEGHALVRIQDDQIQRLAVERPRDPNKVLAAVTAELELAPEVAAGNYYSIPYVDRSDLDENNQPKKKPVEGLSVRAAETLARSWGNNAVSSGLLHENDDTAVCVGTFVDFENAHLRRCEVRTTRTKHKRGGGTYRLDATRWSTEIQKASSIAARNATLQALPLWLKRRYFDAVRATIAGAETPDGAEKVARYWLAVRDFFAQRGILPERVATWLGHPLDADHPPTPDEVADLRGVRNAIEHGELAVSDLFADVPDPTPTSSSSSPLGGTATVTRGADNGGPAQDGTPAKVAGPASSDGGSAPGPDPSGTSGPEPRPTMNGPAPVVPPAADPPADAVTFNARGLCPSCGRHRKFVEGVGHAKACKYPTLGTQKPELELGQNGGTSK